MKTRFAPSPTGQMHLGNARTALFNFLYAQHKNGTFLLRIEDTDKARSQQQLADELMADLTWLGIQWQEGPGTDGPHRPYWQSERESIYNSYYEKLLERDLVYPCFCSDEELALQRKIQISRGQPPRYAGTCRRLTEAQLREKRDAGEQPSLRFHVPEETEIVFDDLVKGRQVFLSQHIGDFIIRRADGSASFIFCNAIDDALMGVECALRGDDHLTNTPRQILILQALQLPIPRYGHLALILGNDGAPLSKRNGSLSIAELREKGFLPEAILNYLGRLGHYYEQSMWLNTRELADFFEISHLGTSPARFDEVQLLHWQRESILHLNEDMFWFWCGEDIFEQVPKKLHAAFYEAIKPNALFPAEVKAWATILFETPPYDESTTHTLKQTGKNFFAEALMLWPQEDFKTFTKMLSNQLNVKGKALFEPLRLALTGRTDGPELGQLEKLLGKTGIQKRLEYALELCA